MWRERLDYTLTPSPSENEAVVTSTESLDAANGFDAIGPRRVIRAGWESGQHVGGRPSGSGGHCDALLIEVG